MRKNLLSILIPLYNEETYIATLLDRVMAAPLPEGLDREICIVDDCSRDLSYEIVADYAARYPDIVRLGRHEVNRGKGMAIRSALAMATGEFCVFQDADLEYDPRELARLLRPMLEGNADVVYGSRFAYSGDRRVLYFWHSIANQMLTLLSNMVSDLNLTDMETCYKAFRTSLLKSIPIRSERFGIEPELTIKVAQRRARVYEIPISYHGRTYEEGKKIGLKDAFDALWVILKFGLTDDSHINPAAQTLYAFRSAPKFNGWMADTLRPWISGTVLELGAGVGTITAMLVDKKQQWVVSDIDEHNLGALESRFGGRRNVVIRRCNLEDERDFAELAEVFDSVLCTNVIEHVADDERALRNIRSTLRAGGRAVFLVPQDASIAGTLDRAFGHVRRYSQAELAAKLENAGFRVERMIEFNRVSRPFWFMGGRVAKFASLNHRQLALFDRFVWLFRRIDNKLPWPSNSLVAVAERTD
jgi:glycosyltransferase involved in cell wall biosynthesis/phospholipid N-methyltransferase